MREASSKSAVTDPDKAFGGDGHTGGRRNVFSFNTPTLLRQ